MTRLPMMLRWTAALILLASAGCSGGGGDSGSATGGGGTGGGGASGGTPPPPPAPPPPIGGSAGTGNSGPVFVGQGVSGPGPDGFSNDPMPALVPNILASLYVGGAGNQYLKTATIDAAKQITITGSGDISVRIDGLTGAATVSGDIASTDASAPGDKPGLPGAPPGASASDARHGLTYNSGYKQVAGNLQQPWATSSSGWTLWNWTASQASAHGLMADSRCYGVFAMPDGNIAFKLWCDGGNSTLARDPRRIDLANPSVSGAWQSGPNSASSSYVLVNPLTGAPISGTFLRSHVTYHAVDRWGRVYIPKAIGKILPTVNPDNPFGHSTSASSGLFVLAPNLKTKVLNARLGGTPVSGGSQFFNVVVIRDNLLVLAGTTNATDLVQVNPTQGAHGGGQDGLVVVLRLWANPSG